MRPSVPDMHMTDPQDAELANYRPLVWQAVVGLLLGLLAPAALVDPTLWSIPALGTFISCWALRRIRINAPAMAGRKIAITGLILALLFLAAAPTDWLTYRTMVRREARQFAVLWFKYLNQDEPQKAFQLTVPPQTRQPLDSRLWAFYRNTPHIRENLDAYVESPLVRTLLALGPKAQVRFYQVANQTSENDSDQVEQWYAVTYEEGNERKSFFVLVRAARLKLKNGGAAWRIMQTDGGGRPAGW